MKEEQSCDLITIIDRSGSMQPRVDDVIGGFNTMLAEQKKAPGDAAMTVVLFDHEFDMPYIRKPIKLVPGLDKSIYVPRGATALLDAIGRTLTLAELWGRPKPSHQFIVAIFTDGLENASKEHSRVLIRSRIERLVRIGWEFIYMGANQDAWEVAQSYGIPGNYAMNYSADSIGTQRAFGVAGQTMSTIRSGKRP